MAKKTLITLISIFLIVSYIPASIAVTQQYDLEYDDNGNLVQGINYYYEYDDFNQLSKVREDSSSGRVIEEYFYDHEGNRVKKVEYAEDGSDTITYYLGDMVRVVDGSGTHDTIYYSDGSSLVGRKDPDGKEYFYHSDHLGSTNIVTDESGNIVEETEYSPFGEVLVGGDSRYLFTGQEKDKGTNLNYYGARYYDSFLMRFTQPDTIIQNAYDPQLLNRYSYVRNNPVKYTDPSGHIVPLLAIPFIIGTIAAGVNLIYQIGWEDKSIIDGTVDYGSAGRSFITWTVTGFAAIGGGAAATAGLAPLEIGGAIAGRIISGGLIGAASGMSASVAGQASYNALSGQPVTANVYESAVSGAGWGGVVGGVNGGVGGIIGAGSGGRLPSWSYKTGPVTTTGDTYYYRYYDNVGSEMRGRWLTPFETGSKYTASRELAKIVPEAGTNPYTLRAEAFVPAGTRVNIGYNIRGTPQIQVVDDLAKLKFKPDIPLR